VHVVAAGQQDRAGDGDVGSQLQLEVRIGQVHVAIVVDPCAAWTPRPVPKESPLARGLRRTASGNRPNQNLYCIEAASTSPLTLYLPVTVLPVAEVEVMFGSW
jgi:hypothetical protein